MTLYSLKPAAVLIAPLSFVLTLGAADPRVMEDQSWITVSGTAVSPTADYFMLDYGAGTVRVEMDDQDLKREGIGIQDGNRVTVSGRVDNDLFEKTSIEASSVYVEEQGRYYFASARDDETWIEYFHQPIVVGQTTIRGKVSYVNEARREFSVSTGKELLTVSTWSLGYNPLDEWGYQRINVGDRVLVSGTMTRDFLSGRELEAERVVTLVDTSAEGKQARATAANKPTDTKPQEVSREQESATKEKRKERSGAAASEN